MQNLLDKLETLICKQTANSNGNFEDLLKREQIVLPKKEQQARYASQKMREALQEREAKRSALLELRRQVAGDEQINTTRRGLYDAEARAREEVSRAIKKLNDAIARQTTSHSHQAAGKGSMYDAYNANELDQQREEAEHLQMAKEANLARERREEVESKVQHSDSSHQDFVK